MEQEIEQAVVKLREARDSDPRRNMLLRMRLLLIERKPFLLSSQQLIPRTFRVGVACEHHLRQRRNRHE
jgi:hypothetical protein